MTSRFLYTHRDTAIHRMHPNTKLLLLVLLFAAVLAFNHPAPEGGMVVLGIVLLGLAGSLDNLRGSWKFLALIFVMSTLLWILFVKDIVDPTVLWQVKPVMVERGTTPYDLVMIIVLAGLLFLAIVLLSLVQILVRDIAASRPRAGWYVALSVFVLAGIGLLWRGNGLVPHMWIWYAILAAYFLALSAVVLRGLRTTYALALWLGFCIAALSALLAVQGFFVHLATPGVVFVWGPTLSISREALLYGPAMGLRIVAFLIFGLLFISTTSPQELTQGLRAIGMPLSPSIALSLAFRLVPTFAEIARNVMQAQQARGLNLDSGGRLGRLKRTTPVIVPTLGYALRSADDLTRALETRGLGSGKVRTEYRRLRTSASDWVAIAATAAFAIACILARIAMNFGELLPRL